MLRQRIEPLGEDLIAGITIDRIDISGYKKNRYAADQFFHAFLWAC